MAKRPTVRKRTKTIADQTDDSRREQRRALERAHRQEKQIQRLAATLARVMQRTNDRLQALAAVLASHARALEAERDVDRSLAGAGGVE